MTKRDDGWMDGGKPMCVEVIVHIISHYKKVFQWTAHTEKEQVSFKLLWSQGSSER